MGIFSKIKCRVSGENKLKEKDLIEMRDEYESTLEICDNIIQRAEYYREYRLEEFVTGEMTSIEYEDEVMEDSNILFFPSEIKRPCRRILNEFNPRHAECISRVRECFNEHIRFVESVTEVVKNALGDIETLQEKMERVKYMKEANDAFEHDGFDNPADRVEDKMQEYVSNRVGSVSDDDGTENMDINQMVLFVAEVLRRKREDGYDVELCSDLSNSYQEQSELVYDVVSRQDSKDSVRDMLGDFESHSELFPLKDEHIEYYIIPRVFHGIPSKSPREIDML
jgi:hypothetical protein